MKKVNKRFFAAALSLLALASVSMFSVAQSGVTLSGAGATFPATLYAKFATEFKAQTGVEVNYQAVGSGAGRTAIQNKTVDFAGSDSFLSDATIIDIPTVAGAVVLTYNLPNLGCVLKFPASTVAGIFLGEIKTWRDGVITKDNPTCNLPNSSIIVVHRSDGSGTTSIFTNYLSKISDTWKNNVGAGSTVSWPTDALGGLAGQGNSGVAQAVTQNPNAIGYVELIYALNNNLGFADVQNPQGQFVQPSLESTVSALAGIDEIPADFNISPLTLNVDSPGAYPIVGPTYYLVYKDLSNITDAAKAQALVDFICWSINGNGSTLGQDYANGLNFAKLPTNVRDEANTRVKALTFNGAAVNATKYCP